MNTPETVETITIDNAARLLGRSTQTVRRYLSDGRLTEAEGFPKVVLLDDVWYRLRGAIQPLNIEHLQAEVAQLRQQLTEVQTKYIALLERSTAVEARPTKSAPARRLTPRAQSRQEATQSHAARPTTAKAPKAPSRRPKAL